ncbi:MAG: multidrug transporter [Gammaproteobacteria bacterium]
MTPSHRYSVLGAYVLGAALGAAGLGIALDSHAQDMTQTNIDSGPATVGAVREEAPDFFHMMADFLIARPAMVAMTAAGTGFFLASLPVSVIGGNVDEAAQRLVVEPASYVVNPCLGCLPYGR